MGLRLSDEEVTFLSGMLESHSERFYKRNPFANRIRLKVLLAFYKNLGMSAPVESVRAAKKQLAELEKLFKAKK